MKSLIEYIQEQKHNFIIGKKLDSSVKSSNIVIAEDKDHLKKIIKETTSKLGFECDLNFIDVSNVTDMSNLFARSRFNGDISRWNVSNVTNMRSMFGSCINFEGKGLENWDVSNVTNANHMFQYCKQFTGKALENWNVSNVKYMDYMFSFCKQLDCDLSKWDVSKVEYAAGMFIYSGMKELPDWYMTI